MILRPLLGMANTHELKGFARPRVVESMTTHTRSLTKTIEFLRTALPRGPLPCPLPTTVLALHNKRTTK